jgi:hypothetical protein
MPQSRRTNVKFKNATRNLSLRVVLEIPTFGQGHVAMGANVGIEPRAAGRDLIAARAAEPLHNT